MITHPRWIVGLIALALTAAAAARPSATSDITPLPAGPSAELCRAEAAWGDPAAGILDAVRTVRCLGWTETADVGRVYAVTGNAMAAVIAKERAGRMQCGATAADVVLPGLGAGQLYRCRRAGFDAFALMVTAHGRVYAAEGLDRFARNILAALGSIKPGLALTALPPFGAAAEPAAMAVVEGTVDAEAARERRAVVLDFNTLGRHGEAREVAMRNTATRATAAADQIDAQFEAALTSANLDRRRSSIEHFAAATALLQSATGLSSDARQRLTEKQDVYLAIAAIDRKAYQEAYADALQAEGGTARRAAGYTLAGGDLALDAGLHERVNTVGGRRAGSELQLRAQALYVIAVLDRIKGDFVGATAALAGAETTLSDGLPGRSGQTPNIQWLRSALATERGRVAEAPRNPLRNADTARAAYVDAVTRLDAANGTAPSIYAGAPVLAQRLMDEASFLVRDGKPGEARIPYARAVRILAAGGAGYMAGVSGLNGYLKLLAETNGGKPGEADRDEFFYAAQLFNPLAVAAQIAQLKQVAESGSSEAAVRAKAINDLLREREVKLGQLATTAAASNSDGENRLRQDVAAIDGNIGQLRSQQSADVQYQQVTDTPLTRAELQSALLADEAYYKLVSLPGQSYAMLIEHGDATLFAVGATPELRDLAAVVRKSASPKNKVIVPFNVEASQKLFQRLFGPIQPRLARLTSLVTEPAGVMAQLPYAVLVSDPEGPKRWLAAVEPIRRLPSGDPRRTRVLFDLTMVTFLGTQPGLGLSTSVSPRALVTVRNLAPAAGGYIGFGGAVIPDTGILATLPRRGAFKGQCSTDDARLVATRLAGVQPIAVDELQTAAARMGGNAQVVTGADFTDEAVVAKHLRDFAVLHFATHGYVQGEIGCDQPPALLTSVGGGDGSDGLLTIDEIANLSLNANLVILAACDTSASFDTERGADDSGFATTGGDNALTGLVRSFLYAGARAVLTTYWQVPDTVADEGDKPVVLLVDTMFRAATEQKLPIAAAVARGQIALHRDPTTSHPAFWGAFVLIGDGTKPLVAPKLQSAQR